MNAPLLFVTTRSMKNRVWKRIRRLREPRYLLGLVAGLAYVYWAFVRNQLRASHRTAAGLEQLVPLAPQVVAGGALALWVVVVVTWLWPFNAQPWSFTAPEVQFFFTAPIARRRLVDYKLLRSHLGVLFTVLMISFFSGAARAAASGRWSFVLGAWLFFTFLQLHVRGATLTKLSFRAPAGKVPALAWASAAVMALLSAVLLGAVGVQAPSLMAHGLPRAFPALLDTAQTGLVAAALWPFAAIVRPALAVTRPAFIAALGPALLLLAVNYLWVVSSDASFEDAATAAERRESQRRGVPTVSSRAVPFRLASGGGPEGAILWKNTILLGRYFSLALLVRVLIPLLVLSVVVGLQSRRGAIFAPLFAMVAVFMTVMGPYMMRNDLRHDMPRLPVLKTWPISGRQLVTGELLAPTVILTVMVWCLVAVAVALAPPGRFGLGDAASQLAVAAGAAVLAPVLIAGQVLVQNAAVVLFPGWIATGGGRVRGIEAMGQNLLMFAGTLLALAVGLLPAAAVSGGVGYLLYLAVGWAAVLPAAVVMAAILAVETYVVIGWLGALLERTDPGQVEVAE